MPISFASALLLALAITSVRRGSAFWQTMYFLPVTSNLVAMAVVWDYLLHSELGFAAQAMAAIGLEPVNWLNDRRFVLWTVGAISTWQLLGYYVVLFVAGLANISIATIFFLVMLALTLLQMRALERRVHYR